MPVTPLDQTLPITQQATNPEQISKARDDFKEILAQTVQEVREADMKGDAAIIDFNSGKAANMHDVVLALEEADISIRMLVQTRNKALDAYNEIMRLQL